MRTLEGLIVQVSLWMARIGGALLLAASFVIAFEILARKFFLLPFNVGTELSTYALAVGASWSFSYALMHRAHVRIDVVRNVLPARARMLLDLLALISLAALALVLSWHVWGTVATSWSLGARENTPLATPIVIPQGLWFAGILWFAFVALEQTAAAILALLHGDPARFTAIAGPAGTEAEIEQVVPEVVPHIEQAR